MRAGQPRDITIAGKQRFGLHIDLRRGGRQQVERRRTQRSVGHNDQAFRRPPSAFDRFEQHSIELVREPDIEAGISLTIVFAERLAEPADLGFEIIAVAGTAAMDRPVLGTAHTKLASWPK